MAEILQIEHLVKQYRKAKVRAVNDISFSVEAGEFFCLLGINGAGKSTTINMVCTLLSKTSGDVRLAGYTLGKQDHEIRKSIGVVFQGNVLDNVLTVKENILLRSTFYGLSQHDAKKRLKMLAAQLSMKSFLGRPYGSLSGGQRRKCDIVRALMGSPKILFLDEPTTGLDPQSRIELWETIHQLREDHQMTVFLTTHYMEETEQADRVAIVDQGNLLCLDTPQRLKSTHATDLLKLVVQHGSEQQLEALLPSFTKKVDTYLVKIEDPAAAIALLVKAEPFIHSFEMQKGNMDHVFVNVVGREAE